MNQRYKRAYFSLIIFVLGLTATIIALQSPAIKQYLTELGRINFWGTLIGGILYAFAFTSSLATALFLNLPEHVSPLLAAIIGGLGSAIYDISIFAFVRRETDRGFLRVAYDAMRHRRRIPHWLSLIIGVIILGSPLPDELAAGFLGFMKLSTRQFILISFASNAVGIYLLTALH